MLNLSKITLFSALLFSSICSAATIDQAAMRTPDTVATSMGQFQFSDGIPNPASASLSYDALDRQQAINSFMNSFAGASVFAIHKGFLNAGVNDNDVLIFSKLMDARSLFLTANADTVYFISMLDLSKGPLVVEVPPQSLGTFDDAWFRWIIDFGAPGPDRGQGGKYLLIPPGYKGPLPESGYFIGYSRSNHIGMLGRSFLVNDDPAPTVATIKQTLKIYPYTAGGFGSSIASFLAGKTALTALTTPTSPRFVEGSGLAMNTIPPNDASYFSLMNELIQSEPADALDPEIAGQLAAVGIVKDKPFQPDARMTKILDDGAKIGNAISRTVTFTPRVSEGFRYYGEPSYWSNPLFVGGYDFMNPPPMITPTGVKPFPSSGAHTLDARTAFFYCATGVTPSMCMRLPNVGSQYLFDIVSSNGKPFDGAKNYKVILPAHIPAAKFWSLTLYDNQNRSMLNTEQHYPRAGSQNYPTPSAKANPDGSTTIYFGPQKPKEVPAGNWIQTLPGKGWFVILRLYSPLESFFDKSWRPSEIQEI